MFQRLLFVFAALAVIGVTAGSILSFAEADSRSLIGEATASKSSGIRGRRTMGFGETSVYCVTQACTPPSVPFEPASGIQCDNDICTPQQCCDGLCFGHTCPLGFSDVVDSATVCAESGCTDDLCCTQDAQSKDKKKAANDCSSFECGHGFTSIEDASEEECDDNVCSESQCCDKVCSGFDCPPSHIHVDDAENTVCDGGECKNRQCCQKPAKFCSSFTCPRHFSAVDDADYKECPRTGCNARDCCESKGRLLCSSHTCAPGTVLIPDADDTECNHGCPQGLALIDEADTTSCGGVYCSDDVCCRRDL